MSYINIAIQASSFTYVWFTGDTGLSGQTGERGTPGFEGIEGRKGERGEPGIGGDTGNISITQTKQPINLTAVVATVIL